MNPIEVLEIFTIWRKYSEFLFLNKGTFSMKNKERQNKLPFRILHISISYKFSSREPGSKLIKQVDRLKIYEDYYQYEIKIIKKGQTNPVYSVYTKQSL